MVRDSSGTSLSGLGVAIKNAPVQVQLGFAIFLVPSFAWLNFGLFFEPGGFPTDS